MAAWDIKNTGLDVARGGIFKEGDLPELVGGILNGLFAALGVVFLVLIVYGGMQWLLSEGQEKKVKEARGFIFHSVIGLVLVLAAFAITNFVIQKLTEQTIQ